MHAKDEDREQAVADRPNWIEEMQAGVDLDDATSKAKALDAMEEVYSQRQKGTAATSAVTEARKPIDAWFLTHPEDTLEGEGWHFKAWLKESYSLNYEAPAAIKARNPGLYGRLEELAVFAIDTKKLTAAIAAGDISNKDLEGYMHPATRSVSLRVEPLSK